MSRCKNLSGHREHVKEAAQYQTQVDNYEAAIRQEQLETDEQPKSEGIWSEGFELIMSSFVKALSEDRGFERK